MQQNDLCGNNEDCLRSRASYVTSVSMQLARFIYTTVEFD